MVDKPKLLFVCGRNKKRSRTAEQIFKTDARFLVCSAGLSPKSNRKLSKADLQWADLAFVMEPNQRAKIQRLYEDVQLPPVEVLNIADDYEFMDEELVELLTDRISDVLQFKYDIS